VLDAALAGAAEVVLKPTHYDLGAARYHRTGEVLTDDELEAIKGHDVILLGAVGDPSVPSGVLERGLLLKLRFALDQYVNLRPVKLFDGVTSPLANPGNIDFVVVREGTEGPYAGNGGTLRKGTPHEIATEVSLNTAYDVERLIRYAFELASRRERKHLTLVHKNNVLVNAGDLYLRTFNRVAKEYPQITTDYYHVDATTIYLTTDPSRFDVIVTDNLFGDIITDQAAAVSGGIGLAASGCINPEGEFPSMFEPIHGSAPDIAGKGIADPTATILSMALMLAHFGYDDAAAKIQAAVEADLANRAAANGTATDANAQKAQRTTAQIGADIAARLG
jgi:3-isopropylmalate dehydrogenase